MSAAECATRRWPYGGVEGVKLGLAEPETVNPASYPGGPQGVSDKALSSGSIRHGFTPFGGIRSRENPGLRGHAYLRPWAIARAIRRRVGCVFTVPAAKLERVTIMGFVDF